VSQERPGRGRSQQHPEHQQRAHGLKGDDHRQGHQQHHQRVVAARREAGHVGLFRVEAQQQERPGSSAGHAHDGQGGDGHDDELLGTGAQDLSEQDGQQVTLEGDHHDRANGGPEHARQAQQDGACDAGQDPMRQRITDEGQTTQHHERPDDRARDRHQHARDERALHEGVLEERVDQGFQATSNCY